MTGSNQITISNTTTRRTHKDLITKLGDGPLRFHDPNERFFLEQLASLTIKQRECYNILKRRWERKNRGFKFTDQMYLRFARNSPGKTKFNKDKAWKMMKKFNTHYLTLTAAILEDQLFTKTLFIPPNLRSKEGTYMFYMRPSRYFPKLTSIPLILDNLAYCMQVMQEKEKCETEGIGLIANMNDWTMSNFSVEYCKSFMKMLQVRIPVRVCLFLIVNPPSWFDKVWTLMKPFLTSDFRKKVHRINEGKLSDHLEPGFEKYLPDEFKVGTASTDDIVADFICYRKFVETSTIVSK